MVGLEARYSAFKADDIFCVLKQSLRAHLRHSEPSPLETALAAFPRSLISRRKLGDLLEQPGMAGAGGEAGLAQYVDSEQGAGRKEAPFD